MEHDAERVDVSASRYRFAAYLFRAGALERHDAHHRQGSVLGRVCVGVEQLRDPEVEELRQAVGRDEDVAGFQIPVNDEMLMCVLHGGAHLKETREAPVDGRGRWHHEY
jgi:hypothetical protein